MPRRSPIVKIPRVWCEVCGQEIQPAQVLLGRCPHCGEAISFVMVDKKTIKEVENQD